MAAFERVLITAPDRLARNYVHQMLLVDELTQRGCRVEFVERPMSDDPHDQLLLQIRAAVAEYERTLIAERMRRGRQAKLRSGQLLPWTRAPYGYLLDAERPRDPSRVRLDPVQAAVVEQMFAWYSDPGQPSVCMRWPNVSVMPRFPHPEAENAGMWLRSGASCAPPPILGVAYSGRTQTGACAPPQIGLTTRRLWPESAARPTGRVDCRASARHHQPGDLRSRAAAFGSQHPDGPPQQHDL